MYSEDLLCMGIVAFKYYVPAAIQYANSDDRQYDCGVAHTLLGILEQRWRYDREHLSDLRDLFRDYCLAVLGRIDEMNRTCAPDYRIERKLRRFLAQLETD